MGINFKNLPSFVSGVSGKPGQDPSKRIANIPYSVRKKHPALRNVDFSLADFQKMGPNATIEDLVSYMGGNPNQTSSSTAGWDTRCAAPSTKFSGDPGAVTGSYGGGAAGLGGGKLNQMKGFLSGMKPGPIADIGPGFAHDFGPSFGPSFGMRSGSGWSGGAHPAVMVEGPNGESLSWEEAYGPGGPYHGGRTPRRPGPGPGKPGSGHQIFEDWQSYWDETNPGESIDWAGGRLTMGPHGSKAFFEGPGGNLEEFTHGTSLNELYENPAIRDEWNEAYGADTLGFLSGGAPQPPPSPPGQPQPMPSPGGYQPQPGPGFGDPPPNMQPPGGGGGSMGMNFNKMTQIQPYYKQGMDWVNKAYDQAQENIPQWGQQASQKINQAYSDASAYLPQMYQQQLQPALQDTLNTMGAQNMIDSSVGTDALAGTARGVSKDILGMQANLSGKKAGLLSGMAGDVFRQRTGLAGQRAGTIGGMGSQYANQASGLHGGQYELLGQMLPTLIQYSV